MEIRSPSTALIDLNRKKRAYERFGVPSYWIVNPDLAGPEFTVFELRDGRYELELKTTEAFTASRPFPVSIVPASLTSRAAPRITGQARPRGGGQRGRRPSVMTAKTWSRVAGVAEASWNAEIAAWWRGRG